MKNKMKNIGIIGMGSVGISISWILQQKGLNVIAFKKSRIEAERFENSMKEEKIKIINKTEIKTLEGNPIFNVQVTSSLQEIAEKSDLILYCSLFPQNISAYHFNESQIKIINQKKYSNISVSREIRLFLANR